jgi:hypothetical protein
VPDYSIGYVFVGTGTEEKVMTLNITSSRTFVPGLGRVAALLLTLLVTSLAGCDSGGGVAGRAQQAQPTEATHQDFGDFQLHYNAVRTDQLPVEVARAHGFERSGNRVILNVSLLAVAANGKTTPVDGTVTATAHNLNGQLKGLQMRRAQEGDSIYFIGDVGISGTEILVFNIEATPAAGGGPYSVQFKREFVAD